MVSSVMNGWGGGGWSAEGVPWGSGGSASRWRPAPAAPPAVRTTGWAGSDSSCPGTSAHWTRPSFLLVVSGTAGGRAQHRPSPMRRARRGWWVGGLLSPTVSKEIPAASVRGGETSHKTPFEIPAIKRTVAFLHVNKSARVWQQYDTNKICSFFVSAHI